MSTLRAGGIAVMAVALSLALTSCGSNDKKVAANESSSTSSPAPAASAAATPNLTIPDYVRQQGITETPVKRTDSGAPQINLPTPPGWEDMGAETPQWAWSGMKFTGDPAVAANPPTIIALLSKLQGNVDPKKILEYAPGEMKNLPGYTGEGNGSASQLGGFDAWQIGGTYMRNDVKHAVAQKTVTIPGADGLFVLQLNADGPEDQMGALANATTVIDQQTTITPAP